MTDKSQSIKKSLFGKASKADLPDKSSTVEKHNDQMNDDGDKINDNGQKDGQ